MMLSKCQRLIEGVDSIFNRRYLRLARFIASLLGPSGTPKNPEANPSGQTKCETYKPQNRFHQDPPVAANHAYNAGMTSLG